MSRAPQFTQAQVRRAVKAAESLGIRVTSFTVNLDGSVTINSGGKTELHVDDRKKDLAPSWDDYQ